MRTRGVLRWATQLALAVLLGMLVWPTAVAAVEIEAAPASIAAALTYTVDPDNRRVGVEARVTVRHLGGAGSPALTDVSLVLPQIAALSLSASRNGEPVETIAGVVDGDFQVWSFVLGRELSPGRTAELSLRYDLVQVSGHRVESATRLNPAYVSFPALGLGDAGAGSIRVLVPSWFEARWVDSADLGVAPVEYESGLARVYEVIGAGSEFVAIVEARDDSKLDRRTVEIEGIDAVIEVAGWPDDGTWTATTGTNVASLILALEDVVGRPWPLSGPLVVRESNAGLVHGFGGSFVRTSGGGGEIEVGPVLDDQILAHELAHAWFDDRLDPWLAEGLAAEFGRRAAGRTSGSPQPVLRSDPDAVALGSWLPFGGTSATDRYAYGAAEQVARELTADMDPEQVRWVVEVLLSGGSPFSDQVAGAVALEDWQRLLDVVTVADGSSSGAEELLVEWVLVRPPAAELATRSAAIVDLAVLGERAGDWGIPLAVSISMTQWSFETANRAMLAASELLDQRDRLTERSVAIGVAPPLDAQSNFVTDTVAAAEALRRQAFGLDGVAAASDAVSTSKSWVESVGLWGYDESAALTRIISFYEAGEHQEVVVHSESLLGRLDRSERDGARRVAGIGAFVALAMLALLVWAVARARRCLAPG